MKKNFLRGRRFTDIRRLNEQALSWLNRTGNKKVHDIYLRTPKDMFINDEKPHLKPYSHYMEDPDREATLRTVHKDNTVRYEGSICDVPPRTFNGKGTQVIVDDSSRPGYLLIKDLSGNVLVQYQKSDKRLVHYKLPEELLNRKMNINERILREKFDHWEENESLSRFIKAIREKKRHYANDTIRELKKIIEPLDLGDAMTLVKHCADNGITSIAEVRNVMERFHIKERQQVPNKGLLDRLDNSDYTPGGSGLADY